MIDFFISKKRGKTFADDMYVSPWIVELSKNSFTESIFSQSIKILKSNINQDSCQYKRSLGNMLLSEWSLINSVSAIARYCLFSVNTFSRPHDGVSSS